ncbi:MAG: transcription termination factor NusA [Candidatus Marinimicrobia bacterium]|nr:transcription termination factor NusA [Candidatus Neomarinimicrobiota bacterium]MBT3618194.1 transcription termination factor NusA [Candidatus Neomarinimicrobiota bacterium]MBT3828665.1 transcription termination factor NusA [Candidatus Neomarinimicrobiota bacterium]MBT3996873.1 transcription termination factor NusA [Candidatus Neomarinimicrobiota bacterium]MBT4280837.1 transcription termination factor NusA [Candidatus Neomarinimicrobiota bacterium]
MINRELIDFFADVARSKNVERSELGTILEQLFLYIIEKERGEASNVSVIVNLDKGEIEIFAEKEIVDEVMDPVLEISLEEAQKIEPDLEIGDSYVEVIEAEQFGRRMVHSAKQFFSQRLLDIEKQNIYEDYANRIGEIIIGTVRQVHRDRVFVNIEQAELIMPRKEQISTERYRRGDTIRALIKSVEVTPKGPEIIVSRSDNHFLYKLFEMEVPEIEDGFIEITAIARQSGERAKIIVKSSDRRIDPVGACVGMRGSRIQAIVRELDNEKIDIVNSSDQPEVLISRALSPAKPINLFIEDQSKYCVAIFDDDDLDIAIGRGGVNINLASKVTQYRIDAYGEKEYQKRSDAQKTSLIDVPDFPKIAAKSLEKIEILTVGDLDSAEDDVLDDLLKDEVLEKVYDTVDEFIKEAVKPDIEEEEVELPEEIQLENNGDEDSEEISKSKDPVPENADEKETSKEEIDEESTQDESEEKSKTDEPTEDNSAITEKESSEIPENEKIEETA